MHLPIEDQQQKLTKFAEAITGIMGLLATPPASRISARKCERSGDAGCLGDAETVTSHGQRSIAGKEAMQSSPCSCWSMVCGAA